MTRNDNNQSQRLPAIPSWLINEPLGLEGKRLRTEWMKIAGEDADEGDPSNGRSRLGAAMLMLQSERPSRPLLARANARALRWADAKIRQSRLAVSLQTAMPELPWSQRLMLRFNRLATPIAACFVLLMCKAHVLTALESIARFGDKLARLHVDRHIGPMA